METKAARKTGRAPGKNAGAKTGWANGRYYDAGISGIIGILGQPRTGKSYRAAQIVKGCGRVAVFDPLHQYGNAPSGTKLPGFVVVRQPGELVGYLRRYRGGRFRVLYQPASGDAEHFDYFLRVILATGNCIVLCDEVWIYTQPSWMPAPLRTVALAGRHRGVSFIYTAQRPARVAADLRSVTTQWKVFRLTSERDLMALRNDLPPEVLSKLPRIADRVWVEVDDQGNSRLRK